MRRRLSRVASLCYSAGRPVHPRCRSVQTHALRTVVTPFGSVPSTSHNPEGKGNVSVVPSSATRSGATAGTYPTIDHRAPPSNTFQRAGPGIWSVVHVQGRWMDPSVCLLASDCTLPSLRSAVNAIAGTKVAKHIAALEKGRKSRHTSNSGKETKPAEWSCGGRSMRIMRCSNDKQRGLRGFRCRDPKHVGFTCCASFSRTPPFPPHIECDGHLARVTYMDPRDDIPCNTTSLLASNKSRQSYRPHLLADSEHVYADRMVF